jgi:hypothetical protein
MKEDRIPGFGLGGRSVELSYEGQIQIGCRFFILIHPSCAPSWHLPSGKVGG